jgi:hypothetical protein
MPRVWRAPSYRQLTAYRGVAVQPNYQHARRLECKGALPTARRLRSLRLSPDHGPPACLPIIGSVAASASILTVEKPRRLPGDRLSVRGSIEPVRPLRQGRQHGGPIELRGRLLDRLQPWVEHADVGLGPRRPSMGVTGSRPAWNRPEGVVVVADARVDPSEASCRGSHAYG